MSKYRFIRWPAAALALLVLWQLPVRAQKTTTPPDLLALANAERTFAAASVEKGLRASFIEFFAEDCIAFNPEPGNGRARMLSRPAPAALPPTVLDWHPIYADISQAGDLGYTTGPYTFVDNGPKHNPTSYGFYFSVWKKQPDGAWKVALDIGIGTPDASAVPATDFQPAPTVRYQPKKSYSPSIGAADLMKLEADFTKLASTKGAKTAYLKYRAADLRLHRDDHFPMVGAEVDHSYLWAQSSFAAFTPTFAEAAVSGDLGYVYGSYELKNAAGAVTEKGYYARVWRRDPGGNWKLAADIAKALPIEK